MTSVRFKTDLPRPKAAQPKPPKLPCVPGPSRLARRLALAYWIERQIESGALADYASAARLLGLSRARLTQVVNMLMLPVETQEDLLFSHRCRSERELRNACGGRRAADGCPTSHSASVG
ncbi:MAG: hypothetical protein HZA52_04120 [Planctomycetes bacterium]|nr:hypothetical protein [Planctomycetota bacterium]